MMFGTVTIVVRLAASLALSGCGARRGNAALTDGAGGAAGATVGAVIH
jgi:hypothetical protein